METVDPKNAEFVRLLEESGWNQVRCSRELSLTAASISRFVSGKQVVRMNTLRLLAELTGGSVNLPGVTIGSRAQSLGYSRDALQPWENDVLRAFGRLGSTRREYLLKIAEWLADAPEPARKRSPPEIATREVERAILRKASAPVTSAN